MEALRRGGAADPGARVFVFDQLLSTATILVKNGSFSEAEIGKLRAFCARMSFIPAWYPGMPEPATGRDAVLAAYRDQLAPMGATPTGATPTVSPAAESAAGASATATGQGTAVPPASVASAAAPDFIQEDLYYWTVASFDRGEQRAFLDGYVFAVDPATDDRPYYTGYVKPQAIGTVLADIKDLSEEWGYLLLVATLVLSLGAGVLIVSIPMIARRRELFSRRKGTLRVIAYFAALGVGYMLVEIFLIQRLTFFLVDPIFSNSIVITTMLVMSGVGSLVAGASRASRRAAVTFAMAGIAATCAFYVFLLPAVVAGLLGLALPWRLLVSVLVIAPAAFCLGIPFPTGLAALSASRPGLVPWAWGVNGALSVAGTVLARLVSVSWGFTMVLCLTVALYALARLVWSGNEAGESDRVGQGLRGGTADNG
jgi:hypothetical protein